MEKNAGEEPEDPWLTLADIAFELRMSPATIRSWVAQGTLRATRAGKRKWLVRRSELDRMLSGDDVYEPADGSDPEAGEAGWTRPMDLINPPQRSPHWRPEASQYAPTRSWIRLIDGEWRAALDGSAMAPPGPEFTQRLRGLAYAAAQKAANLNALDEPPGRWWTGQGGFAHGRLSYELRPGGARPGPSRLWSRFDRIVERLGDAMTAHSMVEEQRALSELSLICHQITDALIDMDAYPWASTEDYDQAELDADDEDRELDLPQYLARREAADQPTMEQDDSSPADDSDDEDDRKDGADAAEDGR